MRWKVVKKKEIKKDKIKLEYHLIPKNIIKRLIWKVFMPYPIYIEDFVFNDKEKALRCKDLRNKNLLEEK